jgi:hypothetical protein
MSWPIHIPITAISDYLQLLSGDIQNNYASTHHKCFTASAVTVPSNLVNLMRVEENTIKTGNDKVKIISTSNQFLQSRHTNYNIHTINR